jgi:hypothetical protein
LLPGVSSSAYDAAIAASISFTIASRDCGRASYSFSFAPKSYFSPLACAVVISRPIVTWRNSSYMLRESGCGL